MDRSSSTSDPLVPVAIAQWLAQIPTVWAVVLGGSRGARIADVDSDVDLYVYSDEEPSLSLRLDLARAFERPAWVGCTAFGSGDEWPAIEGQPAVDLMYWTPAWIQEQLARVLDRHEASVGYSTCSVWTDSGKKTGSGAQPHNRAVRKSYLFLGSHSPY